MNKKTVQVRSPEGHALDLATKEIKRLRGLYRMWRRVSVILCILFLILSMLQGYAYSKYPHPDDEGNGRNEPVPLEMAVYTAHADQTVLIIRNERIRKYGRRRQRAAP